MMNSGGFSPSFYSEERQVGARKMEHMNGYLGLKSDGMIRTGSVASSPLDRVPLDPEMSNGFALPNNFGNYGRNFNIPLGKRFIGVERAASHSLPNVIDRDVTAKNNLVKDSTSHLFDGDKVNFMGAQHENGLFSSSLSDLFLQNLKVSSNNAAPYSNSMTANGATGSHYEEDEEAFESLKELEAKTIGNLLPDDDDLLSGVTDNIIRSGNGEDTEDLDLFSSVGGLELGDDSLSQRNAEKFGDMNYNGGDNPSRTLFVSNINSSVEDLELRMLFEQYGDIRTLYTTCKHRGFVMVSYYDIRLACSAMKALQNKLLMSQKLDVHFSIPKENALETDIDQGALVVFNLDQSVSNNALRAIFGAYGEIKEIRDIPHLFHHKFIEFYDARAAEAALCALSTSDIFGMKIKIEPNRTVGSKSLLQEQEKCGLQLQFHSPSNNFGTRFMGSNGSMLGPLSTNGHVNSISDIVLRPAVSSTVSNNIPSRARVGMPNHLPHSLPEYQDGLANRLAFSSSSNIATNMSPQLPHMVDSHQFRRVNSNGQAIDMTEVFGSSGNGSRQFAWPNSHQPQPQPQPIMWPNSPSFANGMHAAHTQQIHAVARTPSHMLNAILPLSDHHVGSAPSVNPSPWDGRHAFIGESPDASVFQAGSLGNMRISSNSPHPMEFVPHNMFTGGSYTDMPIPSKNVGLHSHNSRPMIFPARSQMHPMMSSLDSPNERTRNRRNEGNSSQSDSKKQFELDIDRIMRGEDKRTTLMIKNIPNKYTSKMLLAAIDERHKGTYDFIYLPIDFKNKCNVGYAFINMTDPSLIVPFYETFNGKKWEKFNSEKVATLAYARIQGRGALIAHFQNSSLMNEDKRCRPILFHTEGPNAGDQVPFPMGSNIRPRLGKTQTSTSEENINQVTGEDYFNGDSSSGSGKDSD